jgi:hypothetical protein
LQVARGAAEKGTTEPTKDLLKHGGRPRKKRNDERSLFDTM